MGTYTGQDKRLQYLFQNGGGGGGTTVIANPEGDATDMLKKLQVGSDIYSVLNEGGLAVTYHANWTATASSASGTKLTQELKIPKGKYIAVSQHAPSSNPTSIAIFSLSIDDVLNVKDIANVPISYGTSTFYFELSKTSRVAYASATGTTMSWDATYIDRGGMDIIAIPDAVYLPEIYSNTERQVGVWTDGKPLYQKTVHISALPSTAFASTTYPHNIANVDKICGWDGTAVTADGTATAKFNVPQFNSSGFVKESSFVANVTKTDIAIIVGANRSTWTSDFTIQYTKTTDTAGSGIWTPSGAQAIHYSTTEQIIGTWIDGKTLYRRTITGLSIPMNADNWIYYEGISVIDNLVNLHAYYNGVNGLLTCAIAEYQRSTNHGVMMSGISSAFNRTINAITIEYTKTTD